jgi:hypothetical protein
LASADSFWLEEGAKTPGIIVRRSTEIICRLLRPPAVGQPLAFRSHGHSWSPILRKVSEGWGTRRTHTVLDDQNGFRVTRRRWSSNSKWENNEVFSTVPPGREETKIAQGETLGKHSNKGFPPRRGGVKAPCRPWIQWHKHSIRPYGAEDILFASYPGLRYACPGLFSMAPYGSRPMGRSA